ncbi:hypothetical protein JJB63_15300 [Clostridium perfringens]|uniref:hypothetical protein n=1 Tax=Clostridium perfringens TaxID=1502 RepID=UPI001A1ACACF|nr:hypothetical protein [Clostridium perfringens]MBO3326935.1 hypothetical protein [Clostridium perfringens]HAT4356360.1 hypothetical protein [Clostridium perfringens]HJF35350.1 hypothetical protein [Clostridium perfringens]
MFFLFLLKANDPNPLIIKTIPSGKSELTSKVETVLESTFLNTNLPVGLESLTKHLTI